MPVSRSRFIAVSSASVAAGFAPDAVDASARRPKAAASPIVGGALGPARAFVVGVPVFFCYPEPTDLAIAVRLSYAIDGGAGPHGDIVAFSRICVHRGCPVDFHADRETMICPCHYTVYDPAKAGQVVIGHASTPLPRIRLAYDERAGTISATGVDGVLYGRFA